MSFYILTGILYTRFSDTHFSYLQTFITTQLFITFLFFLLWMNRDAQTFDSHAFLNFALSKLFLQSGMTFILTYKTPIEVDWNSTLSFFCQIYGYGWFLVGFLLFFLYICMSALGFPKGKEPGVSVLKLLKWILGQALYGDKNPYNKF